MQVVASSSRPTPSVVEPSTATCYFADAEKECTHVKITFDPFDPEDLNRAMKLLPVLAGLQSATQPESSPPSSASGSSSLSIPPPPPPPPPSSNSSSGIESQNETTEDVELDANGDPWDPEIHASSKAKTQKGTWRKRRGGRKNPPPTVQERQQEIPQTTQTTQGSAPPPPPPPPPPEETDGELRWEDVMASINRARSERDQSWEAIRAALEMQGIDATNLYSLRERWQEAIDTVARLGTH